jgi:preprotein translocase subunit SecY
MASASEQLLANLSWRAWSQASDLHRRIFFTLGVFIVYRLGSYIPLPGINPIEMKALASENNTGLLAMFNIISGGALERMSIFALNLMPYITSSIIVQLMTGVFPYFEALKKQGETGKQTLNKYTRYGTVLLASFQSFGIAAFLMERPGLVLDPGIFFYIVTVLTIVGSSLFLMWLGEQISSRGVGNGSSMIIFAGIVASLPQSVLQTLELSRTGGLSSGMMIATILIACSIIGFIVFMEKAYRKVLVQYPKRQAQPGQPNAYGAEQSYMPIKINSTGVLPAIFSSALLGFLKMIGQFRFLEHVPWLQDGLQSIFMDGGTWSMVIQAALMIFFSFFYTSIVFNPEETAESLRKNGAFIPGYRPGMMTAEYIEYLLHRLTAIGSLYLAFIVILPAFLNRIFSLKLPFQGTSFLILVSVSLEIITQVHSYLISHQYSHLLRKKKVANKVSFKER